VAPPTHIELSWTDVKRSMCPPLRWIMGDIVEPSPARRTFPCTLRLGWDTGLSERVGPAKPPNVCACRCSGCLSRPPRRWVKVRRSCRRHRRAVFCFLAIPCMYLVCRGWHHGDCARRAPWRGSRGGDDSGGQWRTLLYAQHCRRVEATGRSCDGIPENRQRCARTCTTSCTR